MKLFSFIEIIFSPPISQSDVSIVIGAMLDFYMRESGIGFLVRLTGCSQVPRYDKELGNE